MPNVASVLKEEIRRLARKEAKLLIAPLKRALRQERKARTSMRKQLSSEAKAAGLAARKAAASSAVAPAASAGKTRGGRALADGWRKDTVRSTRKALGLTQGQFAKLVGVSQITVSFWENGRSTPRLTQQTAVLAAREGGRDKALTKLGLPPGYKARRGRPSNADLAARKQAGAKPARKTGAKRGRKPARRKGGRARKK